MTLIVEDGTGLEDADSYVAIGAIDVYADNFGKSDGWSALSLEEKEVHARRATQFADNKYPFGCDSVTSTQSLLFPVTGMMIRGHEVTGIPRQLKDAVCELALISRTVDLVNSVTARTYTYRKVKVGDLEKTERFETDDNSNTFGVVELILKPLLANEVGKGMSIMKLRRA